MICLQQLYLLVNTLRQQLQTAAEHWARTGLMQALAAEQPEAVFVLDQISREQQTELPADWNLHTHRGTLADSYFQMQQHRAVYAANHSGYHWFRETVPTCDAILTLAHVLAALSFSDAENR